MKRILCAALAVCVGTAVYAGPKSEKAKAEGGGKLKAALILSGPANDQGWNAVAVQGLKEAGAKYGIETQLQENVGVADAENAFTNFAADGCNLVIGHGNEYGDAALNAGRKFPNARFLVIEGSVQAENVASYVLACEEAGYLMGMLAASMSKTGKIGIVGAVEQPSITKVLEAYKLGARAVNPNTVVLDAYADSYTDVDKGRSLAETMAAQGADVLSHCANQAGQGVLRLAQEKGLLATGDSFDQNSIAPDTILCSTVYSVPKLVETAVQRLQAGTFGGEQVNLGMKDGVVDIAPYHGFESKIPEEVKALIADTRAKITSGEFKVPLVETRTK